MTCPTCGRRPSERIGVVVEEQGDDEVFLGSDACPDPCHDAADEAPERIAELEENWSHVCGYLGLIEEEPSVEDVEQAISVLRAQRDELEKEVERLRQEGLQGSLSDWKDLRAQRDELLVALRPFAEHWGEWLKARADHTHPQWGRKHGRPDWRNYMTVGKHVAAARAVIVNAKKTEVKP